MLVTIYMAISADGFIAGPENETPWSKEEWEHYKSHLAKADGLIIGRKTYDVMHMAGEFETLGFPQTLVVSRGSRGEGFYESPEAALDAARQKAWGRVLVGGGTALNSHVLHHGLAHRLHLDIEPVLLGNGLRLFTPEKKMPTLCFLGSQVLNSGTISSDYEIAD